jgi:transaldolase
MQSTWKELKIKLFADGANLQSMIEMASQPHIAGLTTNPTLMNKAGVSNYVQFAREVIKEISDKPISFEVFSDDLDEMRKQAEKISSWGDNVYVKIPISNTQGESTSTLVKHLTDLGIKVNVTAIMTSIQVEKVFESLNPKTKSYVSLFAGRIADTGRDPIPVIKDCLKILSANSNSELIWASPRELLNVIQAEEAGCHVITATGDILAKLKLIGYDLNAYSLDTVKMFYNDAKKAGYNI